MTIFRLNFAGQIKKAETKQAGSKTIVELSLCKKEKGRNGGEDSFTWVKITLWDPADFQIDKLVNGAFVAGSGEFKLRSYDGKDGKATSAEVRCTSFDIEVSDGAQVEPDEPKPAPAPRRPAPSVPKKADGTEDEPPF